MATIDSEKLIAFEYGTFNEINGMSKQAETLYFADDKPMLYALGMWHGIDKIDGSFDSKNGTLSIKLTSGGTNPVTCTIANVGMTDEQISQLSTAYTFVNSITGDDTDTIVNKWDEIVAFLNAVEGTTLQGIMSDKADKTTEINAGDGLTGGGDLSTNRTISLGTPSTITDSSTNTVTADSHTHAIDEASTTKRGIVQLNDSLTSTSTAQALTANQGKVLDEKITNETTARQTADNTHTAAIQAITDLVNDMFEKVTDNGTTYIKTKYGFASDEFVSAKGKDDETSGAGIDLSAVWDTLANNTDSFANTIINIAHIPDITAAKISDFTDSVKALLTADNMPTITASKISDFATAVANAFNTNIATWSASRKVNAGNGLTGGGDLSADRTLSLATIGTAGTYTKVVVDAYGRVTGNSTLLESDIPALSIGKITNLQSTINTINANFANYLPLTGGVMKNTNLVTNLNADLLDGVHLADVYRKSGWNRVVPYIYTNETLYYYWFKVAQINYTTASGLAELEVAAVSDANFMYAASARLTIKGYSGETPSCSVLLASNAYLSTRINVALDKDGGVWVKTNCSWTSYLRWRTIVNDENYTGITILNGSTKQLDQPVDSNIIGENTGTTYRKSTDAFETLHATFDVGVGCFRSPTAQVRILPYTNSAYIKFGNSDFTKNVPAYITGYNSSPLDLLTISSHSTIFSGTVTIGGADGVTISYDATNDMLKFSKGGYFLGAVSSKGVSNDTGTGGTGVDLSAVWESLTTNTDPNYGSAKIHVDHIPLLPMSKIENLESTFTNVLATVSTHETSITTIKTHLKWKKVVTATA